VAAQAVYFQRPSSRLPLCLYDLAVPGHRASFEGRPRRDGFSAVIRCHHSPGAFARRCIVSAACTPNISAIASRAGRALRKSPRVHSGFSSSGRDAASSRRFLPGRFLPGRFRLEADAQIGVCRLLNEDENTLILFLNPGRPLKGQKKPSTGWVTLEDLREWAAGEGPIVAGDKTALHLDACSERAAEQASTVTLRVRQ
jgi:hypothetical protein